MGVAADAEHDIAGTVRAEHLAAVSRIDDAQFPGAPERRAARRAGRFDPAVYAAAIGADAGRARAVTGCCRQQLRKFPRRPGKCRTATVGGECQADDARFVGDAERDAEHATGGRGAGDAAHRMQLSLRIPVGGDFALHRIQCGAGDIVSGRRYRTRRNRVAQEFCGFSSAPAKTSTRCADEIAGTRPAILRQRAQLAAGQIKADEGRRGHRRQGQQGKQGGRQAAAHRHSLHRFRADCLNAGGLAAERGLTFR